MIKYTLIYQHTIISTNNINIIYQLIFILIKYFKDTLPVNSSTVLVGILAIVSFFTLPIGNTPCCTNDKAFLRAILKSFFLSIFSLKKKYNDSQQKKSLIYMFTKREIYV